MAKARLSGSTTICATRYGNVMASRGSVIPLFVNQIKHGHDITITDPDMTRFMMTLDNAVDLVLHAFSNGSSGDIFVQKSPAATIETLCESICDLLEKRNHPRRVIGTRHGEKLYEVLLSREEMHLAEDQGNYYRIPADFRNLDYGLYVEEGVKSISKSSEYTSHNTSRLGVSEMKTLLNKFHHFHSSVNLK